MRVPSCSGERGDSLLCVTSASLLLLAVVVPADAAVVTLFLIRMKFLAIALGG